MHRLIITANPSSTWFTHVIADTIKNISQKKGNTFEILNLYRTDLKQDFLTYENKKEIWVDEVTKKIQEKIINSDELIFIFPIWWWDAPAIMKNFIDSNFTPWFAYQYAKWWKILWLLKDKSARVIATSWWPSFFYKILLPIQLLWKFNRISFCWIKQKSFHIFGNMDRSKVDKHKYLDLIEKIF